MAMLAKSDVRGWCRATGLVVLAGLLLCLVSASAASAARINLNCDSGGDLQSTIDSAAAGATILVKGTCAGPFSITDKSLTLQGNPQATLDGQLAGSTLLIDAPNESVTLNSLTIQGGKATDEGGGIHVVDGLLTVFESTVQGNQALGGEHARGGGIAVEGFGFLDIEVSSIIGNKALAEPASGSARADGGGIFSAVGVTLNGSVVRGNVARASSLDQDASAHGGGIETSSELLVRSSSVKQNVARATGQGASASAYGGGIEADLVRVRSTEFLGNSAIARSDTSSALAYGGGLELGGDPSILGPSSIVEGNHATATAADSARSQGGGIDTAGSLLVRLAMVNGNGSTADSSAADSTASGGGIQLGSSGLELVRATIGRNQVVATSANDNALATGGGVDAGGSASLTNSTVGSNSAAADATGPEGIGTAKGGGMNAGSATLTSSTVGANSASASGDTHSGKGGGVSATDLVLVQSIIAGNTAQSSADCFAPAASHGYNLVVHRAGCLQAPKPSDITGKPAKLGVLQLNDGGTETMGIPVTSPAFNAIPAARCAVGSDQRGVKRPQGPRCDIGAYERIVP
jgi:hypothetical protein